MEPVAGKTGMRRLIEKRLALDATWRLPPAFAE
jgi:hypothetical protein